MEVEVWFSWENRLPQALREGILDLFMTMRMSCPSLGLLTMLFTNSCAALSKPCVPGGGRVGLWLYQGFLRIRASHRAAQLPQGHWHWPLRASPATHSHPHSQSDSRPAGAQAARPMELEFPEGPEAGFLPQWVWTVPCPRPEGQPLCLLKV